eukprot:3915807-Amphidinium_carterae.1
MSWINASKTAMGVNPRSQGMLPPSTLGEALSMPLANKSAAMILVSVTFCIIMVRSMRMSSALPPVP